MKSIVFLALFAVALAAPQGSADQQSQILRQESDINPDGSYSWSYETSNGIAAEEQGSLKKGAEGDFIGTQGQFSYVGEDGKQIAITYVADENGFQPKGDHLPTPPPIPEAILRSLEWNAAHPEQSRR